MIEPEVFDIIQSHGYLDLNQLRGRLFHLSPKQITDACRRLSKKGLIVFCPPDRTTKSPGHCRIS